MSAHYIEAALQEIFGDEFLTDQHSRDTARRVHEYWLSLVPAFIGGLDAAFTTFVNEPPTKQLIVCANIPFHSACAHHLLPFEGHVHIGYKPDRVLAGLSKFPRAVKHFAQRPQTQELFARDLADYLYKKLEPTALLVRATATHTCTTCRGVVAPGTYMVNDVVLGDAQRYETVKAEFLSMIESQP